MPEFGSGQLILLVMLAVVLSALMLSTRKRVRQSQQGSRIDVRAKYAELQETRQAVRDVEQVLLELDEVARQIQGRIDTRLAKLESVLRDADARIDKLSRLVRAADGDQTIDVTLDEVAPGEADSSSEPSDQRYADIYRRADDGNSPSDIAQQTGRTIGEIELILALRRTRQTGASSSAPPLEPTAAP